MIVFFKDRALTLLDTYFPFLILFSSIKYDFITRLMGEFLLGNVLGFFLKVVLIAILS